MTKRFLAVFLSAIIVMFSAVILPGINGSEFILPEITADAKLTPDTPGITMDMLRDEMAAEYQAFIDKFTGPDFDVSYEAIPVVNDRMLESSPEIKAKTLEVIAGKTTDEDKAYAIFDWIVNNIYYDYDHFYDSKNNPTFRPAATAFLNKRTVCEGYSNLYSAMCREAGIPCRVVTGLVCFGTESLEGFKSIFFGPDHRKIVHAWNEVYFNNEWHLVDSTWGSSNMYQNGEFYKYENHTGNYFDMSMFAFGRSHMAVEYNTMLKLDDFLVKPAEGKIYAQKYIGNAESVKINDKIESLAYNIFGEATTVKELILPAGFDNVEISPPFFIPYVQKLVFSEGIKKIRPVLFENAGNVEEIVLPSTLEEIGVYAFSGCTALKTVTIPSSVKTIGDNAFNYCTPKTVYFDGTQEQWNSINIGPNNDGLKNAEIIFKNDSHVHSYTASVTKEPTCKDTGIMTYTCSCGDSYTEIIPKTDNHTPGEWIVDKEPTCKDTGLKHQVCSVCGETLRTEIINKTDNHTPGEWIIDKEPTCKDTGSKHQICSVCGETLKTEIINKTDNHTPGEWIIDKEPTCKDTGSKHQICSVCGETIRTEIINKTENHTPGEWIIDKEPTCKDTGSKHQVCSICGETVATETINKTEHTPEIIPAVAPTCTKEGSTEGKKCSVCGEIITASEKLPTIPHEDKNNDGSCDMCGKEMTEEKPVCNHMCHSENPLMQFIWKIINFFNKLFKINQYCSCGARHW